MKAIINGVERTWEDCHNCNATGHVTVDDYLPTSWNGHGEHEEMCEACDGTGELEVTND